MSNNYGKAVEQAREKKIDKRFPNSVVDHALILIKNIIIDANHEVKVLSDSFNEGFYSQLENDFVNFLNKAPKNRLKIISSTNLDNSNIINNIINKLNYSADSNEKVMIKLVPIEQFPKDNSTDETVNFVVNDNNAFRYEYSDKDLSDGIVSAIANFNNKKDSDLLNKHFDTMFKKVSD